jgi:Suppressor of fused protein (SUFU)
MCRVLAHARTELDAPHGYTQRVSEEGIVLNGAAPDGSIEAWVEADDRVVYLYTRWAPRVLRGGHSLEPVWVRNLTAAAGLDRHAMAHGSAPLMPVEHCAHPQGAPPLDASVELVWLPDGDGVALFERGECLAAAVLSTDGGLARFARDARGRGGLAWELPADVAARFASARSYWRAWDDSPTPWEAVQKAQMAHYEERLGAHTNYYAIDGDVWPPKALLRIPCPSGIALVTVGVSLLPQPASALPTRYVEWLSRIELGMVLPAETDGETIRRWMAFISGESGRPWAKRTWLGPGHTVPCAVESERGVTAVLFADATKLAPCIEMSPFLGDKVSLLWMIPISERERDRARRDGSNRLLETLSLPRRLVVT